MKKLLPISVISQKYVNDGTTAFRDLSICSDVLLPATFVRWFCKKYNHNIDLPLLVNDTLLEEEKLNFKKSFALCG